MTSVEADVDKRREATARRLYELGHFPWACTFPQLERDVRGDLRMAIQEPGRYPRETIRNVLRCMLPRFARPCGLQLLIGGLFAVVVVHVGGGTSEDVKLPDTPARLATDTGRYYFYAHPGPGLVSPISAPLHGIRVLGAYADYSSVFVPEALFAQLANWPAVDELPLYDPTWLDV